MTGLEKFIVRAATILTFACVTGSATSFYGASQEQGSMQVLFLLVGNIYAIGALIMPSLIIVIARRKKQEDKKSDVNLDDPNLL